MKLPLLLAVLALPAAAQDAPLLMKETTPAYVESMRWSWCRVFADAVTLQSEQDGTKTPVARRAIRFGEGVASLSQLRDLIRAADAPVRAETVATDGGEVRHRAFLFGMDGGPKEIVLRTRGDSEADNPTEAAKVLIAFLERNCSDQGPSGR